MTNEDLNHPLQPTSMSCVEALKRFPVGSLVESKDSESVKIGLKTPKLTTDWTESS